MDIQSAKAILGIQIPDQGRLGANTIWYYFQRTKSNPLQHDKAAHQALVTLSTHYHEKCLLLAAEWRYPTAAQGPQDQFARSTNKAWISAVLPNEILENILTQVLDKVEAVYSTNRHGLYGYSKNAGIVFTCRKMFALGLPIFLRNRTVDIKSFPGFSSISFPVLVVRLRFTLFSIESEINV